MREMTLQGWDLQRFAAEENTASGTDGAFAETAAPQSGDPNPAAGVTAADAGPDRTAGTDAPAETDFDAALKDPEFNRRVQDIVSRRVAAYRGRLAELQSALEALGEQYGIHAEDLGKALRKEPAKKSEDGEAPKKAAESDEAERLHREDLAHQAELLRRKLPGFDLEREMLDPRFRELVAPGRGWTVEQAFNAVHHDAIVRLRTEEAARAAGEALANSVRAGRAVPPENGTVQRGAGNTVPKLYSQMDPGERSVFKQQLRSGRIRY